MCVKQTHVLAGTGGVLVKLADRTEWLEANLCVPAVLEQTPHALRISENVLVKAPADIRSRKRPSIGESISHHRSKTAKWPASVPMNSSFDLAGSTQEESHPASVLDGSGGAKLQRGSSELRRMTPSG